MKVAAPRKAHAPLLVPHPMAALGRTNGCKAYLNLNR
jgi:hypothetical protein